MTTEREPTPEQTPEFNKEIVIAHIKGLIEGKVTQLKKKKKEVNLRSGSV